MVILNIVLLNVLPIVMILEKATKLKYMAMKSMLMLRNHHKRGKKSKRNRQI